MKKSTKIILSIAGAVVVILAVVAVAIPLAREHTERGRIAHDEDVFAKIEATARSMFSDAETYAQILKFAVLQEETEMSSFTVFCHIRVAEDSAATPNTRLFLGVKDGQFDGSEVTKMFQSIFGGEIFTGYLILEDGFQPTSKKYNIAEYKTLLRLDVTYNHATGTIATEYTWHEDVGA